MMNGHNQKHNAIRPELIQSEIEKLLAKDVQAITKGLIIKKASQWMEEARLKPIPKMLFDHFWIEGEMCCLFSDTNLGKSILAVLIADSVSRGVPIPGFVLQAVAQVVLYFDFELSDKQFENRYSSNYADHFAFHENLLRVEINPDTEIPKFFKDQVDYLHHQIEEAVIERKAKVLIIDNFTFLNNDSETAKNAGPLMKRIKALQRKHDLSILVLAHVPKRPVPRPITLDDIAGSKMIANFLDSAFAIGDVPTSNNYRYLKQVKVRKGEKVYHADNVCVCEIVKPFNFVKFEHRGFSTEQEHLLATIPKDNGSKKDRIRLLAAQGLSLREIGQQVGMSHTQVGRILNEPDQPVK